MNDTKRFATWTAAGIAGIAGIGALLMGYMITVEGEPGLLPLVLVVGGLSGLALARRRRDR